ncbi:MAG: MEDS domain-containing protein [Bdellovibrio sp.]
MLNFPRHAAGIFESFEEKVKLLRAYFVQARQANHQISLFLHDADKDVLLSNISDCTLDLYQGLKDGWFVCLPAQMAYYPNGHFDLHEMYNRLDKSTLLALDQGFSGLSASGIMSWSREKQISTEIMAEYEYGLAKVFEKRPELQALCLYSKVHFDRQDISVQCCCHPHVVTTTECNENPLSRIQTSHVSQPLMNTQDIINFWKNLSIWGIPLQSLRGKAAASVMKTFSDARVSLLRTLEYEESHSNPEIFKMIGLLEDKMEQLEFCSALSRNP